MRSSATRLWSASLVALALAQTPAAGGTREPLPAGVLARATEYVDRLHRQLAGVVMEERYEQRTRASWDGLMTYGRRTLLSDYLLVQPRGSDRHFGFRDVFAVNDRPVRDRQERLTGLFLDRSASVDRRIERIVADSARYNIGDIDRNMCGHAPLSGARRGVCAVPRLSPPRGAAVTALARARLVDRRSMLAHAARRRYSRGSP